MVQGEDGREALRCKPGDLVRVVVSRIPGLVGATALVERLRSDGRWDVCLDRQAFGYTERGAKPAVTCEFSFRDASLEPIGTVGDTLALCFNHPRPDLRQPETDEVPA